MKGAEVAWVEVQPANPTRKHLHTLTTTSRVATTIGMFVQSHHLVQEVVLPCRSVIGHHHIFLQTVIVVCGHNRNRNVAHSDYG